MVLLGEIRHCVRMRLTFTRPYFGTARRRSKTFAVSRYSGGSRSSPWICVRPALRSRLRVARRVRISFARWSASMRWVSERSGAAPTGGLVGEWAAGGMRRGLYTRPAHRKAAQRVLRPNFARPQVEVEAASGYLNVFSDLCRRFLL